jgi:hypothetical protein
VGKLEGAKVISTSAEANKGIPTQFPYQSNIMVNELT